MIVVKRKHVVFLNVISSYEAVALVNAISRVETVTLCVISVLRFAFCMLAYVYFYLCFFIFLAVIYLVC